MQVFTTAFIITRLGIWQKSKTCVLHCQNWTVFLKEVSFSPNHLGTKVLPDETWSGYRSTCGSVSVKRIASFFWEWKELSCMDQSHWCTPGCSCWRGIFLLQMSQLSIFLKAIAALGDICNTSYVYCPGPQQAVIWGLLVLQYISLLLCRVPQHGAWDQTGNLFGNIHEKYRDLRLKSRKLLSIRHSKLLHPL